MSAVGLTLIPNQSSDLFTEIVSTAFKEAHIYVHFCWYWKCITITVSSHLLLSHNINWSSSQALVTQHANKAPQLHVSLFNKLERNATKTITSTKRPHWFLCTNWQTIPNNTMFLSPFHHYDLISIPKTKPLSVLDSFLFVKYLLNQGSLWVQWWTCMKEWDECDK